MNGQMNRPFVWAHRGASAYCPENTLPAFAKAIELGADGIELDVQMTKDGELVVCHDEKIDRTSDGKGWIKDFTLAELREFDFSYGDETFKGAKIPTLREVFELFADTDMTINIELKTGIMFYSGIEEKTIALTEEYGFMNRVISLRLTTFRLRKSKSLDLMQKVASYTQTELLACLIMQSFTVWKHCIQHSTIYSTRVS